MNRSERQPSVWEVMGSIPVGDSDFPVCPTPVSFDHLSHFVFLLMCTVTGKEMESYRDIG